MIGKPAIAGAENARNAGQFSHGMERPAPPDLPSEKDDGFSAAVDVAVGGSDTHFPEQILGRQGQKGLHARVLQSGEAEAARFKGTAEASGKPSTDAAIAVEEDPAAGGVPSFRISHF
jgi:hypothetical protein